MGKIRMSSRRSRSVRYGVQAGTTGCDVLVGFYTFGSGAWNIGIPVMCT